MTALSKSGLGIHDLRATVERKIITLEGQADSLDAKGWIMAEFNRMVNTKNTVNRIRVLERQAESSESLPVMQKTEEEKIEVTFDKIPAVDTVNDLIQTIIRLAAGTILFSASGNVISDLSPVLAMK